MVDIDETGGEGVNDRVTIDTDVDGDCFDAVLEYLECGTVGSRRRRSRLELDNAGDEKQIEVRQPRSAGAEETVSALKPSTLER